MQQNLERVTEVATRSKEGHAAAGKAFTWLKAVCSTSSYGILRASGWYPPGTSSAEHTRRNDDIIDLGLDSIEFYDRDSRPDVRNSTLLAWIQTLRPHASLEERELVLTCFTSAPELVAAYFAEKNMQLEPKLSNTWIGYTSFLFEVVRLQIPEYLGNEKEWTQLPPQTNIMIESILPRPLTQKILTRCLNQNSELITFFAVRLLVLAFEKLAKIRSQLGKAAGAFNSRPELWHAASERLLTHFVERCPQMKDVIATFRKTPDDDDHALQREALTRLLQLYYEVTPLQTMEEQFDVSTALGAALVREQSDGEPNEIREIRALELEHVLHIARRSPGMRWFSKQGALEFSPILTLLQIHRKDFQNRRIRELIYHVLSENNILSNVSACDALLAPLIELDDEIFKMLAPYLDDWLARATRKPVKYLDDLETIAFECNQGSGIDTQARLPSLLVAVLVEQAPFVLTSPEPTKWYLMSWINSYIDLLMYIDERSEILMTIQKSLDKLQGWAKASVVDDLYGVSSKVRLSEVAAEELAKPIEVSNKAATVPFSPPPTESEDHPELFKWTKKDLGMALEEGDVEPLILCLCSQYPDIRTQAHAELHKLTDKLRNSVIEDKDAMYVLIGELIETYEHHCLPKSESLPYLAGTFATNALRVQMEPTHYMYPKINRYLNKGPEWRIHKLPTYWMENTMLSLPEEDDAYWKETQWVLQWLVDGLRTQADLEILRRGGVFERVMSLYDSPGAKMIGKVREKLMELLWRTTFVEGGSTTLITRTGVLSWLDMVSERNYGVESALRKRVVETCDQARIKEWSGLKVGEL